MPAAISYPGIYLDEIPSGVHTIPGVATSIVAVVGRASRGPTNQTVTINSFAEFENIFGGLWSESSLGFAVRDFYLNGGNQATIVRLYHADPGDPNAQPPVDAPATKASLAVGPLKLIAANEGAWSTLLRVTVDQNAVSGEVAASMGLIATDLFNLTVVDTGTGKTEKHFDLTVKDSPRRVDKILAANSSLILYDGVPDATKAITAGKDNISVLEDTVATKQQALINAQNAGQDLRLPSQDVVDAQTALKNAIASAPAVSDGLWLSELDFLPQNGLADKRGLYALEQADLFNILCIPPYRSPPDPLEVDVSLVGAAAAYCEKRRAMMIVDAPKDWISKDVAKAKFTDANQDYVGTRSRNAALYFPRLRETNPLHEKQLEDFAACGAVAGIWARTDAQRGIWKAPAGIEAAIVGATNLVLSLKDSEAGELNTLGINCLRSFPAYGQVVWGARTLRGADQLADEYKYIPVRRTALYIEESLYRGLKWVVFEPNDEPLWAQIRLSVGAFMNGLYKQGAFEGATAASAYFVKCDSETMTQNDIDAGIVNVVVGFAPLKSAEFVITQIQQSAANSTMAQSTDKVLPVPAEETLNNDA
jgi:Bacteriophage tail sheath protein